ncbi:MAG: penicillin-binding protein [Lachnospiraceae bacterium]|nr:penicillin-binding protein [Lachnospiraceae bacterium]
MLEAIREKISAFIHSRFLLPYILLGIVTGTLIARVFSLQIVHGREYMNNFALNIEKEVNIPGARGNIYDRNGQLLAYNELAYSITLTDTIESGKRKNETLNGIILKMIRIIEKNGDHIINDFGLYLDEGDNFCFSHEGNQHLRFLADIYGHAVIGDLKYAEKTSNPDEVMEYLCSSQVYGIGSYTKTGNKVTFFPQMGYSKEEMLKIAIIRYHLSMNSFTKYIATTVATDVSDKTVAVIMENSDALQGVSVAQDTVRRYNHSVYFSQVTGYTGRISQSEYEEYSLKNPDYTTNDYIGKTGIELSMESELKGSSGSEQLFVDNVGRIIERNNVKLPLPGNDIYLTLDAELQMAAYNLLEQKIAGILVSRLVNEKKVEQHGRNRLIPVYDVYNAFFDNNVINLKHMAKSYAGDYEKKVYSQFAIKQADALRHIEYDLMTSDTPYNELEDEDKEYESFIIAMLSNANYGIIKSDVVDTEDETYKNWRINETISMKEYLMYCISMQWIDISKLTLDNRYADSGEIYKAITAYVVSHLSTNLDFSKKLYKYLLHSDMISGRDACMILWEQDLIPVDFSRIEKLKNGETDSFHFVSYLIRNIYITPAQLGLEPCSGSVVITAPDNGEVLALVSYPGYDTNRLANTADSAYLAKLSQDHSNPLWNYATQQRTAPGSTFKMVSSVAGVEEGVISEGSIIECEGIFTKLAGTPPQCWINPGNHGELNLTGAIENSCNCYFYEVGYRLSGDGEGYNDAYGIEKLRKYADMFGLSEKTGVEIAESEPMMSDKYAVPSAIGQGTHNYTTVGLARYVTAVANSGTVYKLSLIHEIKNPSGQNEYYYRQDVRNEIIIERSLWNAIHMGMRKVVESKSYFDLPGFTAAGKTGTAQEQTNKANHALFVGYAPYDHPEIAIAVRIANGYSSDFAAQVAADIFKYRFNLESEEELITGEASDATAVSGGD